MQQRSLAGHTGMRNLRCRNWDVKPERGTGGSDEKRQEWAAGEQEAAPHSHVFRLNTDQACPFGEQTAGREQFVPSGGGGETGHEEMSAVSDGDPKGRRQRAGCGQAV